MSNTRTVCTKKRVMIISLIGIYLLTPVFSGIFGYYDPRGPLIYPEQFHLIAHRIGWSMGHKGKARIPILIERTIFYSMDGFGEETFK